MHALCAIDVRLKAMDEVLEVVDGGVEGAVGEEVDIGSFERIEGEVATAGG